MAHYVFYLIFGTMVDNSNIEKLTDPFFLIFGTNFGKRTQNGPRIGFLGFFEKICHDSFSWKYFIMGPNIVINVSPTYLAYFGFLVMGQNAAGQSNCRIL